MKYNPEIHHRRSIRLRGYDYAKECMYFITICTQNRIHYFGEVENGIMILNPFGEIAYREWERLSERWPHVELGAFQVMPNHMHGVLVIHRPVSAKMNLNRGAAANAATTDRATLVVAPNDVVARNDTPPPNDALLPNDVPPANDAIAPTDAEIPFSKIQWASRPYLGQIIGAYKSTVSTECLNYHKQNQPGVWLDPIWQRGFDERTIRSTEAFDKITTYIISNPQNWSTDKFFD